MKRKNLLLTTLLLTVTLLMTACSSTPDNQEDIPSESIPTQESTVQDNTAQTDGENVREDSQLNLPKVTITHYQDYRYAEGDDVVLAEADMDKVTIEGEGYEAATKTLDELFGDIQGNLDYLASIAQDDYAYRKSNGETYIPPYSSTSTCEIARLDENIISIKRRSYDYTGGAHGMGAYWGNTIDLKSGKELELIDLAVDSYALIDVCTDYVVEQLDRRAEELFGWYGEYVTENLQNCNWYMDASGIVFVFSPYEIAAYAMGNIEVCVPYSHVAEHMKPEYCGIRGDCIAMIQTDAEVVFTTEGKTRSLSFETRPLEYMDSTVLVVDDKEIAVGDYVTLVSAYLMHNAGGKTFLIYSIDWASNDYETYVYDLTGDNCIQTGNIWACLNGHKLSVDEFSMDFRLDVMGTYSAEMDYALDSEGVLRPLEDIYHIESLYTWSGLTTIKELPVIMGNEAVTLPVGTRLYIVATDNDGSAWFETTDEDGGIQSGLIHYIRDAETYQIFIDGVNENEYFEMLPYAG